MVEGSDNLSETNLHNDKHGNKLSVLGAISSFLLVIALLIPNWIYLTGNLEDSFGPFVYSLADFLFGPVWGFSLVLVIFTMRERFGTIPSRRMSLALIATFVSAGMMVLVACLRASNRGYHLAHLDLQLQESTIVLTIWETMIQGVISAGWHFWGWAQILVGSAGWTTKQLPPGMCLLCFCGGIASLFVFAIPILEGAAILLGVVWASWQGIIFLKRSPEE